MKINRRKFMKVFAVVTTGLSALSKAEEPKYEISCDLGAKSGSKSAKKIIDLKTVPNFVTKNYDLIADLVEEMNKFDKKIPNTLISYTIHCNYTGLAFLNDTGELDKYYDRVYGYAMRKGYTHTLWIPYKQWPRRAPKNLTFLMNVLVRPNLTLDLGLMAHYSTRRNILNKLENVHTLVTTRCFNVNRDEEGKKIGMGGWRPLKKEYPNYMLGDMWTDAEKQQMNKVMTDG